MKTKPLALIALLFVLTTAASYAAITATTGVSRVYVDPNGAYDNITPIRLDVTTNPGQIFLTYKISDSDGAFFTLNSIDVDVTLNGSLVSHQNFSTLTFVGNWNRFADNGVASLSSGAMNQAPILSAWGDTNSSLPYSVSLNPGDVEKWTMTYNIQGQTPATSVGTVTFIPEPTVSISFLLGSTLCFLRRKRV